MIGSKLNPIKEMSEYTWPEGFFSDGLHAGLKPAKKDLGWIYSGTPAAAAGVYTTNQFQAAPTKLMKETIAKNHTLQAIVMNSGNANSCTGVQGMQDALKMRALTSEKLHVASDLVGVASTGIIGEKLPMDVIESGIDQLSLSKSTAVTEAVLTTDQHTKTISLQFKVDSHPVIISGFAKGSGMIHPNMATMLGFVTTDANIDGQLLQDLLSQEVDETFNQITVDGDTSTNDMVVVLANGQASSTKLNPTHKDYATFVAALHQVLAFLAKSIAQDGEGASKLLEVNVINAMTHQEAQIAAKAIVGSNLVKVAIFGQDPNWGRLMGALGQTSVHFDVAHVSMWINGHLLVVDSQAAPIDQMVLQDNLKQDTIDIQVDLHSGTAQGQAWGCDLTYQYVKINAAYHS